jgi:hypothetical protein
MIPFASIFAPIRDFIRDGDFEQVTQTVNIACRNLYAIRRKIYWVALAMISFQNGPPKPKWGAKCWHMACVQEFAIRTTRFRHDYSLAVAEALGTSWSHHERICSEMIHESDQQYRKVCQSPFNYASPHSWSTCVTMMWPDAERLPNSYNCIPAVLCAQIYSNRAGPHGCIQVCIKLRFCMKLRPKCLISDGGANILIPCR